MTPAFPWLEPGETGVATFKLLCETMGRNGWPGTDDAAWEHGQRIASAAGECTIFDTHWRADSRWEEANARSRLRRLLTHGDDVLQASVACAATRLQDVIRASIANRIGPRPAFGLWQPSIDSLRLAIADVLDSRGPGSHRGRPSGEHMDRLASAVVAAYAALSGRDPHVNRACGRSGKEDRNRPVFGPLVDFCKAIGESCGQNISEENRLTEAVARWHAEHKL